MCKRQHTYRHTLHIHSSIYRRNHEVYVQYLRGCVKVVSCIAWQVKCFTADIGQPDEEDVNDVVKMPGCKGFGSHSSV